MSRTARTPRYARELPAVRKQQLVQAGLRCLARGGLSAFTVEEISREAKVSRGLINHHFTTIDDLLAAVYRSLLASLEKAGARAAGFSGSWSERLAEIIEVMFAPPVFSRANLKAWLALWGEAATNPKLKRVHQHAYGIYRAAMAEAIAGVARERRSTADPDALAATVIALIDGLWLEWCLDRAIVTRESARQAVVRVLDNGLGPASAESLTRGRPSRASASPRSPAKPRRSRGRAAAPDRP